MPETFSIELISFKEEAVPLPQPGMGAIEVPGYILMLRRGPLLNAPERASYNTVVMSCAKKDKFDRSIWINETESFDNGTAIYMAPFYKDHMDGLTFSRPLCMRVIIGEKKSDKKGNEKIKQPILMSNDIPLTF